MDLLLSTFRLCLKIKIATAAVSARGSRRDSDPHMPVRAHTSSVVFGSDDDAADDAFRALC